MLARPSLRHGATFLLVCAVLVLSERPAQASFFVAINGVTVAADGSPEDLDPTAGVIRYSSTSHGYAIELTAQTGLGAPAAGDITTSQLMIQNVSGTGPLTITIREDAFNVPSGALGASTLSSGFTRLPPAGPSTSGTVSMTSTATSATGGGSAATTPITFTGPLGAARETTAFDRTSAVYSLTTTVTVTDLKAGDADVLTANSAVRGGTAVIAAPAPSAAVMLLSGLPVLLLRRRPRAS